MLLYFEFEQRRTKAEVIWPKQEGETIEVHLTDTRLIKVFPPDLFFEVESSRKVSFLTEDPSNKRLSDLQKVIANRLQEFVNKS